jgi:hypothetical protein
VVLSSPQPTANKWRDGQPAAHKLKPCNGASQTPRARFLTIGVGHESRRFPEAGTAALPLGKALHNYSEDTALFAAFIHTE